MWAILTGSNLLQGHLATCIRISDVHILCVTLHRVAGVMPKPQGRPCSPLWARLSSDGREPCLHYSVLPPSPAFPFHSSHILTTYPFNPCSATARSGAGVGSHGPGRTAEWAGKMHPPLCPPPRVGRMWPTWDPPLTHALLLRHQAQPCLFFLWVWKVNGKWHFFLLFFLLFRKILGVLTPWPSKGKKRRWGDVNLLVKPEMQNTFR